MLHRLPEDLREVRREDSQKHEVQEASAPATQLSWAELRMLQSIPHCGKVEEALVGMGFSAAQVVVVNKVVQASRSQARRRVMVDKIENQMEEQAISESESESKNRSESVRVL